MTRIFVTVFLAWAGASVITAAFICAVLALSTDTGAGIVDDEGGE